ncbi:TrkH family potassium uptake protein [Halocalculus aciditolerans]|uniref:Potassium transporter TrkH n=1 Tax=Halocalculus aciditolerans TaxID=1383812 RepID=A0A830F0J4_9EURY|nr:TrkH family potassium uptake protein [Halocalculus aciditolerans]GGL50799.1 potassium transporter TrkH [Halocalculus aciditolerans]
MSGQLYVDWRASLSLVGTVVKWLSVPMLFPLAVGVYYGDGGIPVFLTAIAVTFTTGWLLERLDADPDLGTREGFLMVSSTWLAVTVVGAIPYVLEGHGVPFLFAAESPASTLADPVNAVFETMSGFTTTGATVMGSISFDAHSRAVMMWRQQTQWLGGMGIVVLAVAILPKLSVGGAQLMDAEAPGPGLEKLTPRIAETARALWGIYIGLTALEIVLLYALHVLGYAPNMTFYNAVAHGFTTMPTGGFSPEARSIEAFSAVVQWLIVPFMLFAGVNFALFWHAITGDWRHALRDAELRFFAGAFAAGTAVLTVLLFTDSGLVNVENVGRIAGAVEPSLRYATFQMASIVTTTGYANMDFNAWGAPAQYVLLAAMFFGGSAGSTAGAVKAVRWLVILKSLRRELFTTVHPEAIRPIRLAGRVLDESTVRGIYAFTLLYFVIFAAATLLVFLLGATTDGPLTFLEASSAVAATLGNVGPGFGIVGPMNSYLPFPDASKLLMVALMWTGRLEIFPLFVLLTRSYWTD